MPIDLEDRRLVKALLRGEECAFSRFFDDNFPRLYRFAIARLDGDREATRDVVQATLVSAVRRLRGYRGESALFTWLCAICRNEIVDWSRRNARHRQHVLLIEDDPAIRAAVDSLADAVNVDPADAYRRGELARLVQVALDRLPPRYGDALEWKYMQGHSVKVIGARLGISVEAAQSLLARARRAFEDIYGSLSAPLLDTGAGEKKTT